MVSFVATPIGNLKDITLRALETLREADVIFCEDTRHTIKLLNAYEIKKPLYACHKFNETEAAEKILAASKRGEKVAVAVSGKTGTAEIGRGENRRKNAWFIAFAPSEDPSAAVAMIVENGESGGGTAAPRVRNILAAMFGETEVGEVAKR